MFIDELTIRAKAGSGGNGVVRWRHDKYKPMAGPAGGDGGRGGNVYLRAVRDISLLSRYTGDKDLAAGVGEAGLGGSKTGKGGADLVIDLPVGSIVRDHEKSRTVELLKEGEQILFYKGGGGGLGNEYFKSSTNRSPERSTLGKVGEFGDLHIELALVVDVGLVGLPNAGKSSLVNVLTAANSKVGAYTFTTKEPQLGDLYGYVIADIPGLIEGAATGKGLGHKFLRHITRTKMILHLVSLESIDPVLDYQTILAELSSFNESLVSKEQWVILTKSDLIEQDLIQDIKKQFDNISKRVFVISTLNGDGVKSLKDALVERLRESYNS